MKHAGDVVEILEAYDLTGSFREAARLTGCSPMTVARYVHLRETGQVAADPIRRDQILDPFLPKLEEWVERSRGRVRADVAHEKLAALGFDGSERTTRRAMADIKRAYAAGHRRVFRPWIPEPGMWFQFDWGKGPVIGGRDTLLWCAWLAWSRFRVIIPTLDRTLPTVIACLDETLRRFGGCPTYGLTDNERTVTTDRIAGIGVRHPVLVAAARHYGLVVHACVPADPASKGGSESTVKIAKADLVPTEANLLDEYTLVHGSAGRLRHVLHRGQRASSPGDPPAADRTPRRRAPAAPPGAGRAVHGRLRPDARRRRGVRRSAMARPATPSLTSSSASGSGCESTATSSWSSTRARSAPERSPATGSRRRAARGSIRPTIPSARAIRSTRSPAR